MIPLITSVLSKVNKSNINWKTKPFHILWAAQNCFQTEKITILLFCVCSSLQYVTYVCNFFPSTKSHVLHHFREVLAHRVMKKVPQKVIKYKKIDKKYNGYLLFDI